MASKSEVFFEKLLFASRWILAPIFLGLSLALIALGIKFFQEAWHVFKHLHRRWKKSDLVLTVLAMIDIALVGSLIVMVMFSGYENFVSTIDAKGSDSLSWLGKLDAGTLKLKVAVSIVAISSIHLLRIFMQVGTTLNLRISPVPGVHQRQDHVVRDRAHDLRGVGGVAGRAGQDVVRQAPRALVIGYAMRCRVRKVGIELRWRSSRRWLNPHFPHPAPSAPSQPP